MCAVPNATDAYPCAARYRVSISASVICRVSACKVCAYPNRCPLRTTALRLHTKTFFLHRPVFDVYQIALSSNHGSTAAFLNA